VSRYSVNFLQFQFFCPGSARARACLVKAVLAKTFEWFIVCALCWLHGGLEQPVNLAENRVTQHHIPVPHLLHQMLILGCRMRGWLLSYVAIQLIELKLISLNWM